MISTAVTCEVCGNPGTFKWTLNRGKDVVVVDLCPKHEAPLLEIMDRAAKKKPLNRRSMAARQRTGPRKGPAMTFTPLEWSPPEDSPRGKGSRTKPES